MDSILLDQIKDTKYFTYATDVLSGKQLACEYIKLSAKRFFNFLENPNYEFKHKKVQRVVNFFKLLKHSTGTHNKKSFILEPWQEFCVANIFGFVHKGTDKRVTKNVYIEVARKNGKTAFAAGLALYCLVAAGEPNPEIEMIANSSKQANICFTMAKNFSETLDSGKYFKKYRDSLRFFPNKGMLQVLSSEAGLNDGYNSYCFIVDEYHSAQTTENYDVMKSSQGMRISPLAIVITTAGFNIGGPCYNMRQVNIDILKGLKTDETQFSLIYTLDEGDDWKEPKNWIKVSPNLCITVQEDYYHEQIQQAENNPQLEVGIKTKNFNLWLQTSQTWIPDKYITDSMQKLTYDDLAKQSYYCYQAIDLASVGDLTALSTMTYNEDTQLYYFKVEYFVPATALTEAENNFIYSQWYKEGYLNVTPGNVTDYDFILKRQLEINKKIQIFKCSYDQWNSTQFTINATAAGINMIPFSQSLGSFNRPTKEFERLILSGKVVLDYNPITRWTFQNVTLKEDYFENVKPVKGSGYENKIDGVIALLQSLGGKLFDELPDLTVTC